ncbi:TlpA family protein disulfide reductase [Alicyclobacillus acidiphilus]|uniref:TlpA family protein disulfide reductase n=1 Tax=Alicyclobacillus acidiphilus TaxID=182455 RepID=UPI0008317624|nr:redoxin family protein [Alicyclobacillus acidiphilus]
MKKPLKWTLLSVVIGALIVGVGMVGFKKQSPEAAANVPVAPQQGYRMPPFTLTEYPDNKTIDTKDLIGKPIFINIWASWCPPCQEETPDIVKAYKQYGSKVVFLSVNATSQDNMPDVEQFIKHYGITWPVALDKNGEVLQEYNIVGFPTSFFVNRQGIITDVNVGLITAQNLNDQLQRITE